MGQKNPGFIPGFMIVFVLQQKTRLAITSRASELGIRWWRLLFILSTEAFVVCRNYNPPAGYVPTMANPLLDLKYGKMQLNCFCKIMLVWGQGRPVQSRYTDQNMVKVKWAASTSYQNDSKDFVINPSCLLEYQFS